MVHRRPASHPARVVRAVGAVAAAIVGFAALSACGPKPPAAPAPLCSAVTGTAEEAAAPDAATLTPTEAAGEAADAVRDARTSEADETTLVTIEATADGPSVTTHPVASPADAAAVAADAAASGDLVAVDTDAPVHAVGSTNDPYVTNNPYVPYQWAFSKTSFGDLWPAAIGTGVTVAVIDSGVDASHPDLAAGQVLVGGNLVAGEPSADLYGHGTHVAGIIAATTDNGIGVRGAAPGVKILPVKVLNKLGEGTYSAVANGIIWAVDNGADVVNLSLGGTQPSGLFEDAVAYASQEGVTVLAAAGNDGAKGNPASYPGATPGVIAVGAVDSALNRAPFSTCGAYVDLSAPGVSISSTVPGHPFYEAWNGTSMAAPYAAAAAAIVEAGHPACTPAGIEARLETHSTDRGAPGADDDYGAGVVDPKRALDGTGC